ncbi:Rieske (2Fe-2S) protein [Geodermatophilus ruber]|uniref:Cytochrome bc1 complex Rieske iron-sulfur subunit n=1 Tax=Geodermatophilus ruber TaxID=504800 RepID=A0A1I4D2G1_9ACTN|nr:Rieske (2Fe-2S) protein [Geodermatophilus ruber]SFK87738.1 Ferredoxin subunit of nitrite reductase or a ring-hydroxylating dioxygenase [Geodermatophilus ruber]
MTAPPARRTAPACLSRRAVLGAAGAGLGALALAGCGGDGVREVSGTGSGTVLARLDEIPEGGALELAVGEQRIVLARPSGDRVAAYDATCTHQGCAVRPDGDELVCPCHGSAFDPADGGVLEGPATEPLAPVDVVVEGDEVRLA